MQLVLLLAVLAFGGVEVWRWTDADGVVHYTDTPTPGAERLIINAPPPSGSSVAPPERREPRRSSRDEEPEGAPGYGVLAIQSPGQDEVLWNIEGQLAVSVAVDPPLGPGHRIRLYLDGSPAETLEPGRTATRLSNVFRGEHSLRAEVLDPTGELLASSPVTSFVVRQTSILNPVNPLAPAQP